MNSIKKEIKFTDRTEMLSVEEVIEKFQALLHKITKSFGTYAEKKYYKHTYAFSFEDLYQNAAIGLIKAYDNYDESKDIVFMTYAYPMVKGEVLRYMRDVPLKRRQGPTAYDFKDVNLDSEYDHSHNGDSNVKVSDIIPDPNNDIDKLINKEYINELLSQLDERLVKIINLYFYENKTQVEIADILGITQVQVSRLTTKSLKIMKSYINKEEHMAKKNEFKPTLKECIEFLTSNASKEVSISYMTKNLAYYHKCSVSTILGVIKNTPEYEEVKKSYKESPSWAGPNPRLAHGKNASISEEHKLIVDEVKTSLMPKEVIQTPELEEAVAINTLTAEPVENKSDILKNVNIKYMNVELSEGVEALYNDGGAKIIIQNQEYMNRVELVELRNSLDKAIEVYDYMYR